jgi:hypothetical protein
MWCILFNFPRLLKAIMIILLAVVHVFISCLFMLIGYVTTARDRLHLGLSILASAFWPLSLLAVIAYICGQRLVGLLFKPSGSSDESEAAPEPIATRPPEGVVRRIRQSMTHRAGN